MGRVSVNRIGAIFAIALGGCHLLWSVLVAAGLAQAVIDFIFWMHFLKPVFVVEAFDGMRALTLVLVTAAVGYAVGALIGLLWNATHKT